MVTTAASTSSSRRLSSALTVWLSPCYTTRRGASTAPLSSSGTVMTWTLTGSRSSIQASCKWWFVSPKEKNLTQAHMDYIKRDMDSFVGDSTPGSAQL